MIRKHWLHILMDGFTVCLISGSLAYSLLLSLFLPVLFPTILLMTAGIYLVLTLLLWNRYTLLSILPTGTFVFFLTARYYLPEKWWQNILPYLIWLFRYMSGSAAFDQDLLLLTLWLITALFCVVFYILILKLKWFALPLLLGASLLFVLWFLGHDAVMSYIWWFALGFTLVWGGKYHGNLAKKYTMPDYGLWQACALPLAVFIILTAYLIVPKDNRNLQWTYLVQKVDQIEERFSDRFGFTGPRQPFRLSETGFPSSQDQLGGPVKLSGDLVLKVTAPLPLYLRGTLLNEYVSTGWSDTIDDMRYRFSDQNWNDARSIAADFNEPILAELTQEERTSFFPKVEATITHVGIQTSVLFNVHRLDALDPSRANSFTPYFNTKGETFSSRYIEEDESYTLTAYIPNLENADFRHYLTDRIPSIDWRHPLPDMLWEEDSYRDLLLSIQQHYTRIPDNVPPRVYALVDELTQDLTSDLEKILAIQNYLKENYSYTLIPPYTPYDRDFVDYFLFDLQEGYCTYFATALAVLGRAAGLPTRYIEGFLMPSETDLNGNYDVRKLNGHAWVEVYFPWTGWIPFDPTPPGTANTNPGAGGYSGQDIPYWDDYWQQYMEQGEGYIPQPGEFGPDPIPEELAGTSLLVTLSMILLGILLLALLSLLTGLLIRRHRINKQPYAKQFHLYYREILWLLALHGSPIAQGETPYTYAARIDTWLINPESSMKDIAELLVKSTFGSYALTVWDRDKISDFYGHLRKNMCSVIGLPIFYIRWVLRLLTGSKPHKNKKAGIRVFMA